MKPTFLIAAAALSVAGVQKCVAQTWLMKQSGQDIYAAHCASCHDSPTGHTPPKDTLASLGPNAVVKALTTGEMRPMAAGFSETDIQSVAVYLTGNAPTAELPATLANVCPNADPIRVTAASWNGWSSDLANTRFQAKPGITAADVPKLKVKWSFAYPGSKNTQVTVFGNRLFVGSSAGQVYSLKAKTGCTYWRFDTAFGVRAAMSVGKLAIAPSGYAVYVSDMSMTVRALDAVSGKLIWSSGVIEAHPRALLTGAASRSRARWMATCAPMPRRLAPLFGISIPRPWPTTRSMGCTAPRAACSMPPARASPTA